MKIKLKKIYLSELPEQFIREKAGYAHIHSHHTGHDSYVRRMSREHYPRFHIYIKDLGDFIEFDLHLDQKQASYAGAHAHNAEYEGSVVEAEIGRLKDLLRKNVPSQSVSSGLSGGRKMDSSPGQTEEKSFWRKIIGG